MRHFLIRRLKDISLKNKILVIVLFNVIVICFCSAAGYVLFSRAHNDLLYRAVAGNLTFSADMISEKIQSVESLSFTILSDPTVQGQFSQLQESGNVIQRENSRRALDNALANYQNSYRSDGVAFMALYNPQFTNCTNWAYLNDISPEILEEAYEAAVSADGSAAFTISRANRYLLITRTIKKVENLDLNTLGYMLIAIDMEQVVSTATRANTLFDNSSCIIEDSGQELLYASPSLSEDEILFYPENISEAYRKVSYKGHSYFVLKGELPVYGYTYISLVPFDSIQDSLSTVFALILTTLLSGLLVVLFASTCFTRYISAQFKVLVRNMEAFTVNEMTVLPENTPEEMRKDELGSLHRQFYIMAKRIQELIQKNYVNEILTKDAQLKSLKAQINPHFLYNTLESINFRAKASGNTAISQITESLGMLLRSTLSDTRSVVTLQDEWELVQSYMTIQKLRHEDRLEYSLADISLIRTAEIPPLTVQPLVENAIRYGLEEIIDTCHIFIRARRENTCLFIEVANDGSVFEENLLEKLRSHRKEASGFGIGLLNIEDRIHLLFGEEYGLSFCNRDGFAVAVIRIPYRTEVR